MAPAWLRSPLAVFAAGVVAMGISTLVLMATTSDSDHARLAAETPAVEVAPPPSDEGGLPNSEPIASSALADYLASRVVNRGPVVAAIAHGDKALDPLVVVTLAPSLTGQHTVIWKQDGESRSQQLAPQDDGEATGLLAGNSVVLHAFHEATFSGHELGIVYDASAFGSGSPTARFALLRLEDEEWRIVWDSYDVEAWRGSHGGVEFSGDSLSQLVVRSDSWVDGYDELSDVLHESNSGPHRYFVDTWVRDGDGYVRSAAETVRAPYATLVEFLHALNIGDEIGARDRVAQTELIAVAREQGMDDAPDRHWILRCDSGFTCGMSEPLRFYVSEARGEPQVEVYFEERDGEWLISDIQPDSGS